MFKFISDIAESSVNVVADTVDYALGDGDGVSRSDVTKLVEAGLTTATIAVALDVTEDIVESLMD